MLYVFSDYTIGIGWVLMDISAIFPSKHPIDLVDLNEMSKNFGHFFSVDGLGNNLISETISSCVKLVYNLGVSVLL